MEKRKMDKLLIDFKDSVFEDNIEIVNDYAEIGIDSFIEEGILKEIPVVNTIVSGLKIAKNIYDRNLLKQTLAFLNEANINNVDIFPIGKKINDFLTKRGVKTHTDYVDILKKVDINTIGEAVVNLTLKGEYNKIFIIYNHFISFSKSVPSIISLDAKPISLPVNNDIEKQFIFEPGYNDFFHRLYMMDVQSQIIKALFESCVAEHSARMFNMSKATDNAEALLKRLRILYNQMRQASITNEIIEISAGYKNT